MGAHMTVHASECPIQEASPSPSSSSSVALDPRNMMPLDPKQTPAPNQPFPLPIERQKSSIPKAGTDETWTYPSQQMFFNALLRKGWEFEEGSLAPEDMDHVIKIHNANNESAWQEVLSWESLHKDEGHEPKLKSFGGKAKYFSPRAHFRGWLGYEMPFDRHDWIIDRAGKEVRYIIDYYDGEFEPGSHRFAQLDVRPALDSAEAVQDRMKVAWWRFKAEWLGIMPPSQEENQ